MTGESPVCYACTAEAVGRCRGCGRNFCAAHGDSVCAECAGLGPSLRPPLAPLPSRRLFRGAVAALVVAVAASLFLLIAQPDVWPPPSATGTAPSIQASEATPPAETSPSAEPTPRVTPPAGAMRRHVVAAGDTLLALAIRYDTTVEGIATANQLSPPYSLSIGQVLLIPAD